jgi:hypothetical protein
MRIAVSAVAAVLIAVPAYGDNVYSTNRSSQRGPSVAENARGVPQIVHIAPPPERAAIVQVPSSGEAAARAPATMKFERVDEAARARAHAKYEAEKRKWGSPGLPANARLNEHPLMVELRPSGQSRAEIGWTAHMADGAKSTDEARTAVLERARADISWQGHTAEAAKSAEEARAAVLERTARLNVYERSMTGSDPIVVRDGTVADLSDLGRARAILSELR